MILLIDITFLCSEQQTRPLHFQHVIFMELLKENSHFIFTQNCLCSMDGELKVQITELKNGQIFGSGSLSHCF